MSVGQGRPGTVRLPVRTILFGVWAHGHLYVPLYSLMGGFMQLSSYRNRGARKVEQG